MSSETDVRWDEMGYDMPAENLACGARGLGRCYYNNN